MRLRPIAAVLSLAATSAVAAERGTEGLSFSHHSWELACDNTRTCRAAGYTAEDDGTGYGASVLLTRKAGPGQPLAGELRLSDWNEDDVVPKLPLRLYIDRRDHGPVPVPATADAEPRAGLSSAQMQALQAALRRDSEIVFMDAGQRRWPLSGDGASAVLLKMDEFQGRLGTPGALVRKGDGDESKVLPALPAPRVRLVAVAAARDDDARLATVPALRQALRASLGADQDCSGLNPGEDEAPLRIERLSAHRVLASTPCWMGAYNIGTGYWVVEDRAPYRAEAVTLDAVDYADGRIFAAQKGRGLGDCFWSAEWVWDGQRFVQTLEQTSGMCRGIAGGGPWSLPTRVAEVVE
ncbi:hypothetical protein CSC62_06155 [Pseudoxanthomonas jiangsuensis]|uniref:DUF1176 domain-containing protein n=1 Tax=Pseudoxanthomonas jiangsuensis TaxID=619688 RepID=UPI001390E447|nr:DUF1176 domain-containing protein [Pseudoxanthomonas jiangsuensis]KAF1698197.1 hypothetical protein CSC62_06155 [Pseudoxanthomonas jiangsuensis]